jgi:hypothetical protein
MPRLILRLQALFLATVFVAGSFGLSGVDVLLDHGVQDGAGAPRVHFENAGGCADHSGHCLLGRLLADLRTHVLSGAAREATLPAPNPAPPQAGPGAFRPHRPDLSYHSRAPPTPLA